MKKIFYGILCTVLTGFIPLCFISGADAKTIKVGAAINMTGPASTWGQFHAKGQQDYFRYVNEVKGGVGGYKIEMILVDTGYKVPEAVSSCLLYTSPSPRDCS